MTYQNKAWGFAISYPSQWRQEVTSPLPKTYEGHSLYGGHGECGPDFVIAAYDRAIAFYDPTEPYNGDHGNYMIVGFANFVTRGTIFLDEMGGPYAYDLRNLERVLQTGNRAMASHVANPDALDPRALLASRQNVARNRWAFVSDWPQYHGGPCDVTTADPLPYYRAYELLNHGTYLYIEIHTEPDHAQTFNTLLKSLRFNAL